MQAKRESLVALTKDLYVHAIHKSALIPALNALFYPDLTRTGQEANDDELFFRYFWERVGLLSDGDAEVFFCSFSALEKCLIGGGVETLQKITQEIDTRENEILPGITLHIALAALKWQKETRIDAAEKILRLAFLDVIQDPLIHKTIKKTDWQLLLL